MLSTTPIPRRPRAAFAIPAPFPFTPVRYHHAALRMSQAPHTSAVKPDPTTCPGPRPSRLAHFAATAVLALAAVTPGAAFAARHPSQNPVSVEHHVSRAVATPIKTAPVVKAKAAKPVSGSGHGLEGQSFVVAGSAALMASAAAVAVTHPIDTLKTLKQARSNVTPGTEPPPRPSLPGLYKGVFSNILKEAPNAAVYLAMYEVFKTALLRLPVFAAAPLAAMCIAGMLEDAVGSIVRVPAEIINKRLQLGLSKSWGEAIRESFMSPVGVEGTRASWEAVLWRDVPYGGLQIAGYEFMRIVLAGMGGTGLPYSIVAGAVAGLFAAVLTTPADVLVTRMSSQTPQCYLETRRYMSPVATFTRIVKDEGFGALWSGALHRGFFYMPMIGLFFAMYECFKAAIINPSIAVSSFLGLAAGLAAKISPLVRIGANGLPLPVRAHGFPLLLIALVIGQSVFSKRSDKERWSTKS